MSAQSPFHKCTAAFVAIAMFGSSAASAATTAAPRMVDPLAVVSLFGTADSAAAICAGSSAAAAAGAAAASGQAPGAGCVLPVVDAPPPPVAETAPPPALAPVAAPAGGVSVLPLLVGLAAIIGVAALLLKADDEGRINLPIPEPEPVSP